MEYHVPVLLTESINALQIKPGGVYVDLTFGAGGHSRAILAELNSQGRLICFDQDPSAKNNLIDDPRCLFIDQNFRYAKQMLQLHKIGPVDGILADLGVSSHQIDTEERGFSTRATDVALNMRMDQKSGGLTAADVLNTYSEPQLTKLFFDYAELENARKISQKILHTRAQKPIKTIQDLKDSLQGLYLPHLSMRFFARVFQALRIEVNQEIQALETLLLQLPELLKKNGRAAFISYHSLEDRLVKNMFKTSHLNGQLEKDFYGNPLLLLQPVNKKIITASAEEIAKNPRARSAKLRIAEKL